MGRVINNDAVSLRNMGDQVVYSISSTGQLVYERNFYATAGRTQWFAGTLQAAFKYQAVASGPSTLDELVLLLQNMKLAPIKPFLVIRYTNATTAQRQALIQNPWWDTGTGGDDWETCVLNASIVDARTNSTDYICIGDTFSYPSKVDDNTILNNQVYLFAHKSIVKAVPTTPRFILNEAQQTAMFADVTKLTGDPVWLYTNLGLDVLRNSTAPAVLRCFVNYRNYVNLSSPFVVENWGPTSMIPNVWYNQLNTPFINGITINDTKSQFFIHPTIDDVLKGLADVILLKSTEENMVFQGFYVDSTKKLNEDRSRRFMMLLCDSDIADPIVGDYPRLCACLGRKGAEEALRKELDNQLVRMVCQSADCLNGDRTGDVYRFIPTPPCAPINICKPGLDINAAQVTMTNVTFNCNFDSPATTAIPATTPGSSTTTPGGTLPESTTTPGATPSDAGLLPPEPAGSNVPVIVGVTCGMLVLIIIVIVIVVVIKRRQTNI